MHILAANSFGRIVDCLTLATRDSGDSSSLCFDIQITIRILFFVYLYYLIYLYIIMVRYLCDVFVTKLIFLDIFCDKSNESISI